MIHKRRASVKLAIFMQALLQGHHRQLICNSDDPSPAPRLQADLAHPSFLIFLLINLPLSLASLAGLRTWSMHPLRTDLHRI